jgi:three-Cys-motif partner protein
MGGEPCLLDPYCGPGQVRVREEKSGIPGGTIAALHTSLQANRGQSAPFQRVMIGDLVQENVGPCAQRIGRIYKGLVQDFVGPAERTVPYMVEHLPRRGLHLAYLDPYSIFALPFSIVDALGAAGNVDLVIHFASSDVSRNLERPDLWDRLDPVAPGWRKSCDGRMGKSEKRHRFFEHWKVLFKRWQYHVSERWVPVRNTRKREIYRLVLASKHPLGPKIWDTLRDRSNQTNLW